MQPPPPGAPPGGYPPPGYPPPGYPPPGYPPPPGYGYPPPPKRSLLWLWILLGVVGAGLVMVAILAAVAVPKAAEYVQKSKRIEAEINLRAIGKAAKFAYIENAMFPVGHADATPAASCCETPSKKCLESSAWDREPWQSLDFGLYDPHYFRYTYDSDGKTFTATAIGDLDCDGAEVVFTLRGSIQDGNPILSEIERPARPD